MVDVYWEGLAQQIDSVFHSHRYLYDHRKEFPWLTGALGDPHSGIWFIAENPSLTQIERVMNPDGGRPTPEAQWWASDGDKLFRDMLVKHGFKEGPISSPRGWHCYITNVVKGAERAVRRQEKEQTDKNRDADIWSSVLAWELANSKPKYVVILGGPAEALLNHLVRNREISLPPHEKIKHYAYIGSRPEGSLRKMHPIRIARYSDDFANIRRIFDNI